MGTNFAVPDRVAEHLVAVADGRLRPTGGADGTSLSEAITLDHAIQRHLDTTRRELQAAILALTREAFEQFVARVLEALGFEDIEVVGRTGNGGIDVRAVLSLQGITAVRTVVQAKKWANTVGPGWCASSEARCRWRSAG